MDNGDGEVMVFGWMLGLGAEVYSVRALEAWVG